MTLNKYFFGITALLILQGCNNPTDKLEPSYLNFKLSKVKSISVENKLMSVSNYYQPVGSDWIYIINPGTKSLLKVNVLKSKIEDVCYLNQFSSSDLFSINEKKREIYLTDDESIRTFTFNGDLKSSFKFNYYNGYVVQINNNNAPVIRNGKVYGHFLADDENTYKSKDFFEQPLQIEIDRKTKTANYSPVYYPASYRLRCYGLNFAPERLLLNKNEQLFTFAYNDTAYVYNEILKTVKPYYFGSFKKHSFDYIDYKDVKKINENAFTEFYFKTERYAFTKVAPLSGFLIRCQLKQDKETENIIENIILYDSRFNYVGESKSEFKTQVLVDTKNGLYNLKLNLRNKCLDIYRLSW